MKYSNLIHNIFNVSIVLLGGLEAVDLNPFFSDPETTLKVVSGLAIAKLVMNTLRDGFTGLTKEQPPVK